ncbi:MULTISPECIES: dolichyl-phosphate-mannose--protein mannosyltransferase [Leptolyngbya]|uniref:dolichyl-phosphate-mannose--protein mannosyltransferase n=1 Tax=Leptolyngbya TaxID=47251 RepID=UPI001683ADB3|nr:phospholipid carrier-dependent glycosyltransferase [Leptolyngbya sp. FACHB-1624]MBD1856858.1 phospholipid carrier-dependent glycosyltransferase [Leptolyngbya sp. FACHB-1624]
MRKTEQPIKPIAWFRLGLLGIFLVSLGLRFWGLERFNTLVFDEVYYAKFANNYLTGTNFFDGHPPLSKYLIAIGIWIGNQIPIGRDTVNSLTGSTLSTWSYRWLNALTGSFIPLVIAAIAFQLSRRRSYALVAGSLAAMDGLFLVESRYALNNVYLVLFGLLGQWCLLLSLRSSKRLNFSLVLSGVFFAASASIKWNGLWFLASIYLLWGIGWSFRVLNWFRQSSKGSEQIPTNSLPTSSLYRLTQINLLYFLLCFAAIPALVYWLIWLPHIHLNPEFDFLEVQRQILIYHQRVGSGSNIHPYCSTWYSWIPMLRPVAYFYQVAESINAPIPSGNSALVLEPGRVVYDVHALGNPFLWWFSSIAIAFLVWILLEHWKILPSLAIPNAPRLSFLPPQELWIVLFLLISYVANLLPWVPVSRCVFLYHYMGSSVYAGMGLAWLVDRWFRTREFRAIGIGVMVICAISFIFWMPIYLGLPLTLDEYKLRMWFRSWV